VAFGLQSYTKKDTMEVTGIVHSLIEQHRPLKAVSYTHLDVYKRQPGGL